jgi:putative nucleotidyltransferase with HDIG domain
VFAASLLFGPPAGTVLVTLDGLVISFWLAPKNRKVERIIFNIAAPALSVWLASHAFFALLGGPPLAVEGRPIGDLLPPLAVFALLYFGLNSWLITFAISLATDTRPFHIWRSNFVWLCLNYFGGASVAALLVTYSPNIDLAYLSLILPLLAIIYFTFKSSMGRVEDANRHLHDLNKLYLSTIETLAMAIDAKDQITHGHIRRVQSLAVGLAKAIGIADERELRAIEAAALLHDMGKLAVPEYILNKPGKLTAAEFEKMKQHASVGADILSAIDFPYPVVPIVRHHHENWDGSGYPEGLAGDTIPIGARILSVVDCFDALTSDRPYRPRMSTDDALAIVQGRRGTMYDPTIVDAFVAVLDQLTPAAIADNAGHVLAAIAQSSQALPPQPTYPASAATREAINETMLSLYHLAPSVAEQLPFPDAIDLIAKHVGDVVPYSTFAFYGFDRATDTLSPIHVSGLHAFAFRDVRMNRGERLTGWVAANRHTIANSDPALDLGSAQNPDPPLLSCLSTPLIVDQELIGVLTIYHTDRNAYSEEHRSIFEALAGHLSLLLARALARHRLDAACLRDVATGLPNLDCLSRLLQDGAPWLRRGYCLVVVGLSNAEQPDDVSLLGSLSGSLRGALRDTDVLFAGDGTLVALLPSPSTDAAHAVIRRVGDVLRQDLRPLSRSLLIGHAISPTDGVTIDELMRAARSREAPVEPTHLTLVSTSP